MKKIEMVFYSTDPSKTNTGLKYVLFEVTTNESEVKHDWGFCYWTGTEWEPLPMPEGYKCVVIWWANTGNPELLLKEESKIVSPHTAPVHIKTGLSGS